MSVTGIYIIQNFYDSIPSVAGCIFYEKLHNTKRMGNYNQFQKELKDLLISDAIIQ
jgi:hypothetical protein